VPLAAPAAVLIALQARFAARLRAAPPAFGRGLAPLRSRVRWRPTGNPRLLLLDLRGALLLLDFLLPLQPLLLNFLLPLRTLLRGLLLAQHPLALNLRRALLLQLVLALNPLLLHFLLALQPSLRGLLLA
jgi:hypothetical protein